MADAFADQRGEQLVEGLQFGFGRSAGPVRVVQIGSKTGDYILPGEIFGNQVRTSAQPAEAPFQHGQRPWRGDAEEVQAIAFAPAVPGPTGSPEARQPVQQPLDVVALDQQLPTAERNPGHGGGGALLQRMALFQEGIRGVQQLVEPGQGIAAHGA
ncbi:hypothetical protein D9M70_394240 [compost metagenome]